MRCFSSRLIASQLRSTVVASSATDIAEHVRMTAHELVVYAMGDIGHREPALLFGDRGVELDLVEQVAELLDECSSVAGSSGSSGCNASTTS